MKSIGRRVAGHLIFSHSESLTRHRLKIGDQISETKHARDFLFYPMLLCTISFSRFDLVIMLVSMNEVALHWPRLLFGWVTTWWQVNRLGM